MNPKVTFRLACVFWTIIILTLLTACSALSGLAVDAVTGQMAQDAPLVGVDTEIVAGDKQGVAAGTDTKLDDIVVKDNGVVSTSNVGKRVDVSGSSDVVNLNEGVAFWQAALACIAMLLIGLLAPQYVITRKGGK